MRSSSCASRFMSDACPRAVPLGWWIMTCVFCNTFRLPLSPTASRNPDIPKGRKGTCTLARCASCAYWGAPGKAAQGKGLGACLAYVRVPPAEARALVETALADAIAAAGGQAILIPRQC